MSWLLLSVLLHVQQVEGLEPGERVVELAPASVPEDEALRHGRVIDAFSALPVEGACVEVWSEEITAAFGGLHRIGEAATGADGRFAVRFRSGSQDGEKVRVGAPGYLTFSGTLGDLRNDLLLFPREDIALRLRVVDSGGRPVAGARLTTTYSCAHDVPAFDRRTDARGEATCPELGIQQDIQELRVRAAGFAAVKYLPPDAALFAVERVPLVETLLRQRPARFRVFDRDGAPLGDRALHVLDGDGYHTVRSDKWGFVTLDSRYDHEALIVQFLRPGGDTYVGEVTPRRSHVVVVRKDGEEWPEDMAHGAVRVIAPAGLEDESLVLHHEDGWSAIVEPGEDTPFPAGRAFLAYGGEFSGFVEEILDFDLAAAGSIELSPRWIAEPRVSVIASDGREQTVRIEAGDVTHGPIEPGRVLAVPPGPLVLVQGGAVERRLVIDEVVDGMVIDLAGAVPLAAAPATKPVVERILALTDDSGATLAATAASVGSERRCTVAPVEGDATRWKISGPLGAPFLIRCQAAGHREAWTRGRLSADGQSIAVRLPRFAEVAIEAPFEFEVIGFDDEDLAELTPGVLGLVVRCSDGRRFGLDLRIEPGARRRIVLAR